MIILFMSSSFHGGGITSFGHEVANAYSKDCDFSIVIGSDAEEPIKNEKVRKFYFSCEDISVRNAKGIILLINKTIKPDVIISSNAKILSVIAPFLNDNIKIITVSHSLKYIESDVAVVAHHYVDYIISGSEYNSQYMARKFHVKDKTKIRVLYNFVKEHPLHVEILENKKHSKEISIVFPGACAPAKSPEIVLQVVRKLAKTDANFKFYWMGRTIIHMSRHFPFLHVRDVRDLVPKDPRIIFPGRLPTREEAENLIASSNIQICPSRREGCPMSFLEAIRVGTIAIVADFGNFNREIVEKGNFGYVIHYNDIDTFAEKIIDICRNPKSYTDFYDNARHIFEKELCYEVWKSRMDNLIYDSDLNHKRRRTKVSYFRLSINILKMKFLIFQSFFNRTFFECYKLIFRMWKLKRKQTISNNN